MAIVLIVHSKSVTSETQAKALSTLVELTGKPIPVLPHPTLNTCTGTVALSVECPVYEKDWTDCENDLLGCLTEYDAESVQCYSIPPRGNRKSSINIAKITFRRHYLPHKVYIGGVSCHGRPYQPLPRQCQKCRHFGHPAKHCRSTARCPLCAQPGHELANCPAQSRTCANCGGPHNVFYSGCTAYKFESELANLRFKLGLTLREARQEAR
nr:uncharacterized protein LOC113829645 [Penaeus vannamei]